MAERPTSSNEQSTKEQFPEVVQSQPRSTFNMFDSSWEHYEPHEPTTPDYPPQTSPAPEYIPQRSPAPEYQAYSPGRSLPSPRLSSGSPPPLSTGAITYSPSASHHSWQNNLRTPPTMYSEFQSPHPEAVFKQVPRYRVEKAQPSSDPEALYPSQAQYVSDDKVYVNTAGPATLAPAYTVKRKPLPPQPVVEEVKEEKKAKRPLYKRPLCIILAIVALIVIAAAVACGVIFGRKSSSHSSQPFVINGDPNLAVGGYLNPAYYSTVGAFNGSGIAIAAANPGVDRTTYVFYQDYTGQITYKLINDEGRLDGPFGTVNAANSKPLNGTAISVVNHSPSKGNQAYHIFYIDQTYTMVERVLQTNPTSNSGSAIPVWKDGTLNDKKLKTMNSTSIGMQACYNNDFYGVWNNNYINATNSIQLWFATAENTFTQYNWTNGSSPWTFARNWTDLNTHAGVGCQTWDSWMLEYVFFVDKTQNIVAYWRDNNRTAAANTAAHPTLQWNKINDLNIPNVHKSSSLGYTTYLLYQHENHTIHGVNISWAAENSTVNLRYGTTMEDRFVVEDTSSDDPVAAIGGTHLSITAIKTSSNGKELQVYIQQQGNEVRQYTRDMEQVNGKWASGLKITP